MLYNPKWNDPFSLDSFIAWLASKPADEKYNYTKGCHCLNAQYFKAMGYGDVNCGINFFIHTVAVTNWKRWFIGRFQVKETSFPCEFDAIARYGEWTFGAAFKRAVEHRNEFR